MSEDDDIAWRRRQAESYLELGRLRRRFERVTEVLLAEQDLRITPAQAHVLMAVIQARRPITARRLAEDLGRSEATVSRFVRSLEADDWVTRERHPEDSRKYLLVPTPRAREALPRFIRVFNALFDRAFGGFEREELVALGQSIQRLHDNLTAPDS